MKVAIIGAGVIGVTTAYELAAQGHQVQVFERNSAAAEATSFANAGVVSAGYAAPWARPGLPRHVLTHLWQRDTPLRIGRLNRHELRWLWQFWKACDSTTFARNREHMLRLAMYSQHRMQALSNTLNLAHDRAPGYMVLLRSERERQLIAPSLQALRDAGLSIKSLNAQEACAIEPALNPETPLVEALHFADDEVSNCRQFTLLLKSEAEVLGAKFHFNAQVQALLPNQPRTVRCAPEDRPNGYPSSDRRSPAGQQRIVSCCRRRCWQPRWHGTPTCTGSAPPWAVPAPPRQGLPRSGLAVAVAHCARQRR